MGRRHTFATICALAGGVSLLMFGTLACNSDGSSATTTFHVEPSRLASAEPIELTLPTTMCRGLFIADVLINGTGPYPMIVDSGASRTVVTPRVKREAGVGRRMRSIRMGDFEVNGTRVKTRELQHIADALGAPVEGIVGHDVFHEVTVTYDYSGSALLVSTAQLTSDSPHTVPTKRNNRRPMVRASIAYNDGTTAGFWLLVDTGSTRALNIVPFDDLTYQAKPALVGAITKINGLHLTRAGRLDGDVTFGPVLMDEPIVQTSAWTNIIGHVVLRHSIVSIDQRSDLVRFEPISEGPVTAEPLRGFGIALQGAGEGTRIARVFEGSTAQDAGIREDDMLIAINGVPTSSNRCDADRDLVGDTPIATLTIERDGTLMDVDVRVMMLVE